jgi:hypothetical protein
MIRIAERENEPTNEGLWQKCLKLIRGEIKSFKHNGKTVELSGGKRAKPAKENSAYLNGRAVQKYNSLGGGWKKAASMHLRVAGRIANLKDWFEKEDWVAINTKGKIVGPCAQSDKRKKETKEGQDPLKCLPRKKAESMTPSERANAARRKKKVEKETRNTKTPAHARTKADG